MNRRRFLRPKPLTGAAAALLVPDVPEAPVGDLTLVRVSRRAMATTGYTELKEFQKVDVVLSHYES